MSGSEHSFFSEVDNKINAYCGGEYAYKNSKTDYELGFISVDSISKSEISFSYFKYPSIESNTYVLPPICIVVFATKLPSISDK